MTVKELLLLQHIQKLNETIDDFLLLNESIDSECILKNNTAGYRVGISDDKIKLVKELDKLYDEPNKDKFKSYENCVKEMELKLKKLLGCKIQLNQSNNSKQYREKLLSVKNEITKIINILKNIKNNLSDKLKNLLIGILNYIEGK